MSLSMTDQAIAGLRAGRLIGAAVLVPEASRLDTLFTTSDLIASHAFDFCLPCPQSRLGDHRFASGKDPTPETAEREVRSKACQLKTARFSSLSQQNGFEMPTVLPSTPGKTMHH
jgi:hypothetical protein